MSESEKNTDPRPKVVFRLDPIDKAQAEAKLKEAGLKWQALLHGLIRAWLDGQIEAARGTGQYVHVSPSDPEGSTLSPEAIEWGVLADQARHVKDEGWARMLLSIRGQLREVALAAQREKEIES